MTIVKETHHLADNTRLSQDLALKKQSVIFDRIKGFCGTTLSDNNLCITLLIANLCYQTGNFESLSLLIRAFEAKCNHTAQCPQSHQVRWTGMFNYTADQECRVCKQLVKNAVAFLHTIKHTMGGTRTLKKITDADYQEQLQALTIVLTALRTSGFEPLTISNCSRVGTSELNDNIVAFYFLDTLLESGAKNTNTQWINLTNIHTDHISYHNHYPQHIALHTLDIKPISFPEFYNLEQQVEFPWRSLINNDNDYLVFIAHSPTAAQNLKDSDKYLAWYYDSVSTFTEEINRLAIQFTRMTQYQINETLQQYIDKNMVHILQLYRNRQQEIVTNTPLASHELHEMHYDNPQVQEYLAKLKKDAMHYSVFMHQALTEPVAIDEVILALGAFDEYINAVVHNGNKASQSLLLEVLQAHMDQLVPDYELSFKETSERVYQEYTRHLSQLSHAIQMLIIDHDTPNVQDLREQQIMHLKRIHAEWCMPYINIYRVKYYKGLLANTIYHNHIASLDIMYHTLLNVHNGIQRPELAIPRHLKVYTKGSQHPKHYKLKAGYRLLDNQHYHAVLAFDASGNMFIQNATQTSKLLASPNTIFDILPQSSQDNSCIDFASLYLAGAKILVYQLAKD